MDISSTHEPLVFILELSAKGSEFSSSQRPFALSIALDAKLAPKMPPRQFFLQQAQQYPDSVGRFGEEARSADAWAEAAAERVATAIESRMGEFELSDPPQADTKVRLLNNQAMAQVRVLRATVAKGPDGAVASREAVRAALDQVASAWILAWTQELGFEPGVLGLPNESGWVDGEELMLGLELASGAPLRFERALWPAFERSQAQQQAIVLQQETSVARANSRKLAGQGDNPLAAPGAARSAPRI